MPLAPSSSDETLLRILLTSQAADLEAFLDVADASRLVEEIQKDSENKIYPVHSSDPLKARGMWRDIEYLERQGLLEFDRNNPHVRLTPTGVFRAMLFDLPAQIQDKLAAAQTAG
jgi:hypothetical protein